MDGTEEKRSDTGYRTEKKKNPQRNKNLGMQQKQY